MDADESNMVNSDDRRRKNIVFNKFIAMGIFLLLLFSAILIIPSAGGNSNSTSRTGQLGNEPTIGYSEGTDKIEIYHDSGIHNTTFNSSENIRIRITSNDVNWGAGGPGRKNELVLTNYLGDKIIDLKDANAFTQQPGGPPYIYRADFTAPANPDHYLLFVRLRDSPQEDRDEIQTWDTIIIGAGATPPKHIIPCSDSAGNSPNWLFATGDTVYLRVYTSGTIDAQNSEVIIADYYNNDAQINIEDLANPTITTSGNDSIIAFNLFDDLDLNRFPDDELKGDYWYTISVNLEDTNTNPMAVDWTAQIKILPPPVISTTDCNPHAIFAEGGDTTTIFTEFSDENATGVNDFQVTFKVRDPDNDIITLVDNKTHGNGGLTITALGGNSYNASYTWNPPNDAVLGDYDLYTRVFDNQNGLDVDDFNNNRNLLTLMKYGVPAEIVAGNTTCYPEKIDKMTNDMVVFMVNFSDSNEPALGIDEFSVTFKIRDEENSEIIIADNKKVGNQGDAQGASLITIIRYQPTLFTAAISWDPDINVAVGKYDLYFSVTTLYGTAIDGFGNNDNELEIFYSGSPPLLTVGDTACIPSSLDIIGNKQTMIYCEFTDADNPAPSSFNVTFKVRPPSNRMNEVITLVDDKAHGGDGEFGKTVTVEQSGTNYIASYNWNPPESVDIGDYDLYFMVRDEYDNTVEDPYTRNLDELELISSVTPPSISAGDTQCVPSSVNKFGTGSTKLYCEFTDSNYKNISDFNVTFKVRNPDDNEIILVDDKPNGGSGEDPSQSGTVEITYSGTVFSAWFEWDPPNTMTPGKYDLYFGVKNKEGGYAKDKFDNNLNELTIETSGNPPEISKTDCFPPTVSVKGTNKTTIFAEFTDPDNPPISNFTVTVKVRDPSNEELILVNDKPHDGAGEFGGTVKIIVSGTGYMASYDWDPSEDNQSGNYDLYFVIKDETFAEAKDDFDDNQDELELIGGAVAPDALNLESSSISHKDNIYNFTITYTDPDNDPPNNEGVILVIGTNNYEMKEFDPSDQDYTDGKKYYYSLELEDGDYSYYFKVTNTDNELKETDKNSVSVGDDGKSSSKEDDNTFLIIAIIIIVIVVVLILVLLMVVKKKSKPSESGFRMELPSSQEPPPPPPQAQKQSSKEKPPEEMSTESNPTESNPKKSLPKKLPPKKSEQAESNSMEPAPTEPEQTEPEPTEIEPTETEPTEPEQTEPEQTEPEQTEPEQTEPEQTEPEPTETEPTEIEPTEIEPTEIEPTEIEPTETEPTEIEPTEIEPTETEPNETERTEDTPPDSSTPVKKAKS